MSMYIGECTVSCLLPRAVYIVPIQRASQAGADSVDSTLSNMHRRKRGKDWNGKGDSAS